MLFAWEYYRRHSAAQGTAHWRPALFANGLAAGHRRYRLDALRADNAARHLGKSPRAGRIAAIEEELRLLPYPALSVNIFAREAELRAELETLSDRLATPERAAA